MFTDPSLERTINKILDNNKEAGMFTSTTVSGKPEQENKTINVEVKDRPIVINHRSSSTNILVVIDIVLTLIFMFLYFLTK